MRAENISLRYKLLVKKKVFTALLTLLFPLAITACVKYNQSLTFTNVQKKQIIELKTKTKDELVHGISIKVTGHIEGEAKIILMSGGKPYRTEAITGKVKVRWDGDWYSDTAEIHYEPTNVKSGELLFEYFFAT